MHKLVPLIAFAIIFLASAGTASADTACFDWACDSDTGICTFDLSCSEATPFIWKYRLQFGDGSSTGLTGSVHHVHTYTLNQYAYPRVTLTLYPWSNNPFPVVSCVIIVSNVIGPPLPTSGRCSN